MNFRIWQDVYIGWCGRVQPGAQRFLCSFGTIAGGPFAPYQAFDGVRAVCPDRSWMVETGGGRAVIVEKILFPINPPDESTQTSKTREVSA